jgi:hypothetical protein
MRKAWILLLLGSALSSPAFGATPDITTDDFVSSTLDPQNWQPAGKYFKEILIEKRSESVVKDPSGSPVFNKYYRQRMGNNLVERASFVSTYKYTVDFDTITHGHDGHQEFDRSVTGEEFTNILNVDKSVIMDFQWNGTLHHPEDAYNGANKGGGYADSGGARDQYEYSISGVITAQFILPPEEVIVVADVLDAPSFSSAPSSSSAPSLEIDIIEEEDDLAMFADSINDANLEQSFFDHGLPVDEVEQSFFDHSFPVGKIGEIRQDKSNLGRSPALSNVMSDEIITTTANEMVSLAINTNNAGEMRQEAETVAVNELQIAVESANSLSAGEVQSSSNLEFSTQMSQEINDLVSSNDESIHIPTEVKEIIKGALPSIVAQDFEAQDNAGDKIASETSVQGAIDVKEAGDTKLTASQDKYDMKSIVNVTNNPLITKLKTVSKIATNNNESKKIVAASEKKQATISSSKESYITKTKISTAALVSENKISFGSSGAISNVVASVSTEFIATNNNNITSSVLAPVQVQAAFPLIGEQREE